MSRPTFAAAFCLALLPASGCALSSGSADVLELEVAPNTVACVGEAEQRCLQVREAGDEEWTLFYSNIEGFEHEEGYRYLIEVERRRAGETIADASAYRYRLLRVISREPAGG